jgi:hypothetical protein
MRGVVVSKIRIEKEKKNDLTGSVKKYILKPLTGGVLGYIGFFSLLLVSKFLGYLIGNTTSFQVDFIDLLLSLLGFAFIFVVKLKEDSKGRIS